MATPRATTPQIAAQAVNLSKNLIGAGIFTLPAALKAGSVMPGLFIMALVGVVQGSTFVMIAFLCQRLNQASYRGAWCAVFGQRSAPLVDLCIAVNGFFACVAYKILVADFLSKALEGLCGMQDASRALIIWANTVVITLPLSHCKKLSALRYTSMLGLLIIGFVYLYVVTDFLIFADVGAENLAKQAFSVNLGVFSTLAMCTGAFQAHYNAPRIYQELNCDLRALTMVVFVAFGLAFSLYASFAVAGLGLFGEEVLGNVLRNYPAEGNRTVLAAWFGMAFAIIFTYPLVFTTARNSLIGLVPQLQQASYKSPVLSHVAVTTTMIVAISSVACVVDDVSVVTGFLGATIGALLCWIFPAVLYLQASAGQSSLMRPLLPGKKDAGAGKLMPRSPALATYSKAMILVGLLSMVVGISRTFGAL